MSLKLKEERERAGYSIEVVANALKIRKQYIIDLEEGNFSNIPGQVYVNGYIKMYWEFLGIDLQKNKSVFLVPLPSCQKALYKEDTSKKGVFIICVVFFCIAYLFLRVLSDRLYVMIA